VCNFEISKTFNADQLLRIEDLSYVQSCVQNIPGMIAEVGPASYTHGKAAQRSNMDKVELLISDLARSRLGVEPAEL